MHHFSNFSLRRKSYNKQFLKLITQFLLKHSVDITSANTIISVNCDQNN